jgi:hypothetical protein
MGGVHVKKVPGERGFVGVPALGGVGVCYSPLGSR